MTRPNAYVGSAINRLEDPKLLTGAGTFVADLRPAGLLHAVILRSPVAHAFIESINTGAARAAPGVVAVITAADFDHVPVIPIRQHAVPAGEVFRQPVIADGKVRYVGEPVAVVIASGQAIAEDALELIELNLRELPVVSDHIISARGDTLLFKNTTTNNAATFRGRMGDTDAAFVLADYTRRQQFSVQRHTAFPMETRGLLAEWDTERRHLTVHGATKVPFFNRRVLAAMLGLEVSN